VWQNAKSSVDSTIKNGVDQAVRETSQPKRKPSLKELTKKYGWTALGVYFCLSALDLPIAYIMVHSMGKERVQEVEMAVKGFFGLSTKPEDLATPQETTESGDKNESQRSLFLTELALAYAIHKSVFIFFRLPLAAAITPWAAKTLQKWGFRIGEKAAGAPRFGTPPTKRQRWTDLFF
jgi:hypothetical protein